MSLMPQQLFGSLTSRLPVNSNSLQASVNAHRAAFSALPNSSMQYNPFVQASQAFQAAVAQQQAQNKAKQQAAIQAVEDGKRKSIEDIDPGEPDEPKVELENKGLWDAFSAIGTEMVITKTGRYVLKFHKKYFLLFFGNLSISLNNFERKFTII